MKYFATLVLVAILAFTGLMIERHNTNIAEDSVSASGDSMGQESY